jgi:hypothetical protein
MADELAGLNRIGMPHISRVMPKKEGRDQRRKRAREFESHLKQGDDQEADAGEEKDEADTREPESHAAPSKPVRRGKVIDYEA